MWSGVQTPLLPPSGYNPNTWLSWKPVTISSPWPGLCCSEDTVLDIFPESQSQTPLKSSSEVNLSIPWSQEVGSPCWPWSHLVSHPSFASPCCAVTAIGCVSWPHVNKYLGVAKRRQGLYGERKKPSPSWPQAPSLAVTVSSLWLQLP